MSIPRPACVTGTSLIQNNPKLEKIPAGRCSMPTTEDRVGRKKRMLSTELQLGLQIITQTEETPTQKAHTLRFHLHEPLMVLGRRFMAPGELWWASRVAKRLRRAMPSHSMSCLLSSGFNGVGIILSKLTQL